MLGGEINSQQNGIKIFQKTDASSDKGVQIRVLVYKKNLILPSDS